MASEVRVEYTMQHPDGHIEEKSTATSFGPNPHREQVEERLPLYDSDCLCAPRGKRQHKIVSRTVSVSDWLVDP